MEGIVPIGPDEWEKVVDQHSISYPGRDVESIRRKYNSLYRKKVPTGDPSMPTEIRMAKRVKYLIGDKAEVCGGTEEYDLENNEFNDGNDGLDDDDVIVGANPIVPPPTNVLDDSSVSVSAGLTSPVRTMSSTSLSSRNVNTSGLNVRSTVTPKKMDFMEMMMLQMQNESAERAHDRKERAEDRRQMTQMIASISTGYFMSKRKSKKKKKKKRRKNVVANSSGDGHSSSSSSSSSSSDSD